MFHEVKDGIFSVSHKTSLKVINLTSEVLLCFAYIIFWYNRDCQYILPLFTFLKSTMHLKS